MPASSPEHPPHILRSPRLTLRAWREEDYAPYARLNADAEVMAHFPAPLSRIESDAMADKIRQLFAPRGWGLWAVELSAEKRFIGCVGLHNPIAELPCSPCTEIGWRLAREAWGHGYATEAASAALAFAFNTLKLEEVVSFASKTNIKSIAVMKRLNMLDSHQDFDHPAIPQGSILRPHVLYKITRAQWQAV